MIFFTADWHLGHSKVIEFCSRPFKTTEEMDETIIQNAITQLNNAKIKEGEHLIYFLGDICFHEANKARGMLKALPGKRILLRGNHDRLGDKCYRAMGFDYVFEEITIKLLGRRVVLSHFPRKPHPDTFDTDLRAFRYMDRRPDDSPNWLLHGHTRDLSTIDSFKKQIHVGVDAWEYKLVPASKIESLITRSEKAISASIAEKMKKCLH